MDRRNLLKYSFSGIAASSLLASGMRTSFLEKIEKTGFDLTSNDNDEDYWELVKSEFSMAKGLYYFNNASLGPCPKLVVDATNEFRALLDGFPSKYMWGGWQDEKEATRQKIADMFSADKEEIAMVHNTTEGMNLVAHSIELGPGDEVILADHEHPSGTVPWQHWQEIRGFKIVRPKLPILPESKEELVEVYRKAITPNTKVISMVHGTNTNGMILPVKEVSAMAHERGILVAVDAAQTAGTFKIDLHDLGCDFYAGSGHKFMFTPKGMGVFYARKESQKHLKPLIVSRAHFRDKSIRRLENYNTRNYPELLGMGTAIDYYNLIGAEKREARLRDLKAYFRGKIEADDRFKLKTPGAADLSCAIQNVEVIGRKVGDVKKALFDNHMIDCRPIGSHGINGVRISLSVFTTKADVDYLVEALKSV
ncbi:aminotransferase class V-fold PLP-dependent enzyme [Roseivirga sp. E12]|uniref:aminotransferase class V-fold PLP-dependent enzyme n=1 Tax=Roseivirga sp. E12 TaxID=2819237 RepID=UPI001ABC7BE7|nr:aminotransferase class V-fold PLP-dependent enzyme [Roseivirga sp. E12]MBO3699855.1 aminotransferase class V-fold PLP-dependent enzyme [Roseivirga sp. E12]